VFSPTDHPRCGQNRDADLGHVGVGIQPASGATGSEGGR
jgi:hypothetical protein